MAFFFSHCLSLLSENRDWLVIESTSFTSINKFTKILQVSTSLPSLQVSTSLPSLQVSTSLPSLRVSTSLPSLQVSTILQVNYYPALIVWQSGGSCLMFEQDDTKSEKNRIRKQLISIFPIYDLSRPIRRIVRRISDELS
ncbi:hypothetical protein CEXT_219301 [Caerostris extrusa]|uniref:Uncharacterized protein n=1 Tax=Caerostris extrusa TaxID=172846 RepID=A0AAV4QI52_CAEEX|nr:hypothetical protein CEXT_219301 [Caerostris extrusa]